MRWITIGTLALGLAGCSAIIDSDQYVGSGDDVDGGGVDGGTDSGPTDGGTDAGEDLCEGVTCGLAEMCDPLTGDCVERCDPACPADEVCVMGGCMDCDVDNDGAFLDGARCAPLRGTAPPDCDDDDDAIFPGAPIVCDDGKINSCPEPGLGALLTRLSPVELGAVRPFRVDGASISSEHRWVSLNQGDPATGAVAFIGTDGPALAHYDLTERAGTLQPLGDVIELEDGTRVHGLTIGFAAAARIGLLFTDPSGNTALGHWEWDAASRTTAMKTSMGVSGAVPPVAIGWDATGGAALVRGTDGTTPTIYRAGDTTLSDLPDDRISLDGGYLETGGALGMASGTDVTSFVLVDQFAAQVRSDVGIRIVGSPGAALLDTAGPNYVAVFPTQSGIRGVEVACTGGFPFDFAECSTSSSVLFGPSLGTSADVAVARADQVVFAAVTTEAATGSGEQVSMFVLQADGTPYETDGGLAINFPFITQTHLGFEPDFLDLSATSRFFSADSPVLLTYVANVRNSISGNDELWIGSISQCRER